mmetsp:Transcript_12582/g.37822  ORF Transcript_12582/g.37822 Transcript_12582/m.37822 type:complete len:251 (-) Transcript_12582:1039-1791(-)
MPPRGHELHLQPLLLPGAVVLQEQLVVRPVAGRQAARHLAPQGQVAQPPLALRPTEPLEALAGAGLHAHAVVGAVAGAQGLRVGVPRLGVPRPQRHMRTLLYVHIVVEHGNVDDARWRLHDDAAVVVQSLPEGHTVAVVGVIQHGGQRAGLEASRQGLHEQHGIARGAVHFHDQLLHVFRDMDVEVEPAAHGHGARRSLPRSQSPHRHVAPHVTVPVAAGAHSLRHRQCASPHRIAAVPTLPAARHRAAC